jgi:Gram-negative bacterial TonB protein C-terminal
MNKIYFLLITGALLRNIGYGQSKADLIRSIEELKVTTIQNQAKIESLQKDIKNLKVQVTLNETKIQSQKPEILLWNQLFSVNSTDIMEVVENNITELSTDKIALDDDKVANDVQIKAHYPCGEAAFRDYVAGDFVYPQRCQDEGINGSVRLRFVVDEAVRISRVQAIEETKSCPKFIADVIRVLKKSPRWVLGQKNGNFLKSWSEFPV